MIWAAQERAISLHNPLHKIEVFYAGRLTERKNGAVVRDLTTGETETGNVYVVAPVPPSVQKAMNVAEKAARIVWAKNEPAANRTAPTPRLGAHPDLTGVWQFNDWIGNYGSRRCGPTQVNCLRQTNQTEDFALYSPSRFGMLTRKDSKNKRALVSECRIRSILFHAGQVCSIFQGAEKSCPNDFHSGIRLETQACFAYSVALLP